MDGRTVWEWHCMPLVTMVITTTIGHQQLLEFGIIIIDMPYVIVGLYIYIT
jgi:hypothetical protein